MPLSAERTYNFGGGLNSTENPASLQEDELTEATNVVYDVTGGLKTRGGQSATNTQGARELTSLFWYLKKDGTNQLIGFENQTMYKGLDTSTRTSIDATTYTQDSDFTFAVYNDILYWTNGVDTVSSETMRKWNGTTASAPSDSPGTACRYLAVSTTAERMMAAGSDTNPERLYVSALGDAEDWTTANDAAEINVVTEDGSGITGIREVNGVMVIFKETSVHVLSGADPATFNLRAISRGIGCTSPKSISGDHRILYFLFRNTLYGTDGTRVFEVGQKIRATLRSAASISGAVGGTHGSKESYWLAYTASGGSSNNRVLNFQYNQPNKTGRGAFSIFNGLNVAAIAVRPDNGNIYIGNFTGDVHQVDTGTTDLGSDIVSSATTGWQFLGEPERRKKYKRLWILAKPSGAYTMNVYAGFDGVPNTTAQQTIDLTPSGAIWGSFTWGAATWGGAAEHITDDVVIAKQAKSMQLKFEAEDPIEVYGFTLVHRRKRIR